MVPRRRSRNCAAVNALLTIRSGRRTPMAAIPTPDLAVPYEAPRQVKTIAAVQPMAPKKGCSHVSTRMFVGVLCVEFRAIGSPLVGGR